MNIRMMSVILGAAGALGLAQSARAQCPCDCYFSGDCESGLFCNWGVLSQEDSCLWRTPKPQGAVGANCDDVYGSFGQCDGICSPSAPPSPPDIDDRAIEALRLWAGALNDAALRGGGKPDPRFVERIESLGLEGALANDMGKMVVELFLIARGQDAVTFPDTSNFHTADLTVASQEPGCRFDAGNLLVETLIAELERPYSGGPISAGIDRACLDAAVLQRVCRGDHSASECLYGRVVDMLGYFSQSQHRRIAGDAPCPGDEPPAAVALEAEGGRYLVVTPAPGTDEVALYLTAPGHPCLNRYIRTNGTLSNSPVYRLPEQWGTVYATGGDIMPDTEYVVMADNGEMLSDPSVVSTWKWGDTTGDDLVDLVDIFCGADRFSGLEASCSVWSADLMAGDGAVDLDDLMAVLDAFAGHPFGGSVSCE